MSPDTASPEDLLESKIKKKKRCYTGCAICRARKVKCDARPGGCSNCERLQLRCHGNESEQIPLDPRIEAAPQLGAKRKKTYRSCIQCRNSKTRCSGGRPVCSRCTNKKLKCVYDSDPDPTWTRALRGSLKTNSSTGAPNDGSSHNATESLGDNQLPSAEAGGTALRPEALHDSDIVPSPTFNGHAWFATAFAHILTTTDLLRRLYSSRLPDKDRIRLLAEHYFANIHPIRCFGFIHKPSFMQMLDEGSESCQYHSALLYAVCALGAKFHALDIGTTTTRLQAESILAAGNNFAREAMRLILLDLDVISVENTMAAILLHDHELRIGRFASAFMLAGLSVRTAQALQLNVEYSVDMLCSQYSGAPSPAARESRRRLMWSCYVMDAWCGSGVDQLTLINDKDVKVQLPCNDRYFIRQTPAITETLETGQILSFVAHGNNDSSPVTNMGMAAYFVRLTSYRKRVLTYVKQLDTAQPPWLPSSEFSSLDQDMRNWHETLPSTLKMSTSAQYIRKESLQFGALCHLHCTYHQTMCDLYRIGMPRLFKIRTHVQYPPERLLFLSSVQQTCFYHAKQIASILQTACRHGIKTLADTWLAVIAHDSNRVMLYYLTKVIDPNRTSSEQAIDETLPLVRSNLEVLKAMMPLFCMSKALYEASANMVQQSGLGDQIDFGLDVSRDATVERPTAPGTPIQSTPEYVLNPLSIYRLARKVVPDKEKHAPELIADSQSPSTAKATSTAAGDDVVPVNTPSYPAVLPTATAYDQSLAFGNGFALGNATAPSTQAIPMANTLSNFDDLQMFFTSDYDTMWQPAETILEATRWGGVAPWESNSRPRTGFADGGVDMFMPSYPWPLSET